MNPVASIISIPSEVLTSARKIANSLVEEYAVGI
jgi:hypothetical protein